MALTCLSYAGNALAQTTIQFNDYTQLKTGTACYQHLFGLDTQNISVSPPKPGFSADSGIGYLGTPCSTPFQPAFAGKIISPNNNFTVSNYWKILGNNLTSQSYHGGITFNEGTLIIATGTNMENYCLQVNGQIVKGNTNGSFTASNLNSNSNIIVNVLNLSNGQCTTNARQTAR